jgi:hypothetical protein
MTEFGETEIPGYGVATYTEAALKDATVRVRQYRVAELRELAARRLTQRGIDIGGVFYRLHRGYILAILASLESDRAIGDVLEGATGFTVTDAVGFTYTLRPDGIALRSVTVAAEYGGDGQVQRVVTDTGALVYGNARVRVIRAVRAYRVEQHGALRVSGPVETARGVSYTIFATVPGEAIEVGYVFIDEAGGYADASTITAEGDRPAEDTRRAWYTLVDAYRAEAEERSQQ